VPAESANVAENCACQDHETCEGRARESSAPREPNDRPRARLHDFKSKSKSKSKCPWIHISRIP